MNLRRYLTPVLVVRLVPITIVLIGGAGLTQWTAALLRDERDLVIHTHQVIETSKDLLITLADAETGQRGYLLTADPAYLTPYSGADRKARAVVEQLAVLVTDDTAQQLHIVTLRRLIADKLIELRSAVDARTHDGDDAAIAIVRRGSGRSLMDAIRSEVAAVTRVERRLLAQRTVDVQHYERRATIIAIIVGIASLLTRAAVELFVAARSRDGRTFRPATDSR